MRKALTVLSKVLANVFTYLFVIILIGSAIAFDNAAAINTALDITDFKWETIDEGDSETIDSEYFKSDFTSVRETKNNSEKMSQEVVKEGSVLLKNENEALPLSQGDNVSLFSISSVDLVYAGTGSSGTNTSGTVDLKTALENSGLTVNADLWNWYTANISKYGRGSAGGTVGQTFAVKDANWSEITTAAKTESADAAIFVLARNGGEGADLTVSGGSTSDMTNGNYLKLSPKESDVLSNLKALKDNGVFGKIIVLLNSANQVECKFIDDPQYGVDGVLWIGDIGSTGIYAVGDLLVGKANPSGRLADTFWKEHYFNPALTNFGDFKYSGTVFTGDSRSNSYVVYQEGIYVGYRYTETRYEDAVMNKGNAGDYVYEDVVSYPFGYGLSYTQFSYSNFKVIPPLEGAKTRSYTVFVTVTNTGSVAGKEVVQIYLQKPYTQYDIDNGIEKAAVELAGFAKTESLNAGASQTLEIAIDEQYFASYDAYNAGTYIIDAEDYYLTAATDAHDAINNILAAKGYTVSDGMTANGDQRLTYKKPLEFDAETYSVSAVTGQKIENQFDNADLNLYEGRGDNHVDYVSRNDWAGTVKLGYDANNNKLNNQVIISATDQMKKDILVPTIEKDDLEYPIYDSTETSWKLIDMRGLDYDSPEWEELLNQLSWDAQVKLVSDGFRRTMGLSMVDDKGNIADGFDKPETLDHNGATGPTEAYSAGANIQQGLANKEDENGNLDPDRNEKPTVYPCNVLVAATYNSELIEEFGKAMGNDCLWAGYSGLYGFGINTHRTTYGGRTFEYYSEDPVLAGQICAAETRGIQAYGCNVYLKHCFLNDQEKNREGVCTWANEQTIREIYLRAFQIAIEDGNAMNVMTGFNRLGLVWTGHQGFINSVLHGEFGMKGCAVSDWFQTYYMTTTVGVLNGNDIPDATVSTNNFNAYKDGGYGELAWALRESAHRILYHTVNSNAMNGITSNMQKVSLPVWWQDTLNVLKVVTGILFGCSVVFLGAMLCWNIVSPENKGAEKKEQKEE